MKTQPMHTPTPWIMKKGMGLGASSHWVGESSDGKNTPFMSINEANAAFIVRAVNAHEELLRLVKSFHMSNGNVHSECDACEAIRKAEGK